MQEKEAFNVLMRIPAINILFVFLSLYFDFIMRKILRRDTTYDMPEEDLYY